MAKNKFIWTAGAVAAGIAAAGAIGLAAGQAMKNSDKKKRGSIKPDTAGADGGIPDDAGELSEESKEAMAEVVWRESGLYGGAED